MGSYQEGRLKSPTCLAVDSQGRLLISCLDSDGSILRYDASQMDEEKQIECVLQGKRVQWMDGCTFFIDMMFILHSQFRLLLSL
jgi:hypothetical protein